MTRLDASSGAAEWDACGIGFVADARGRASREIVEAGLEALARLRHRGAFSSDGRTGDGAGVLLPIAPAFVASAFGLRERSEGVGIGLATLFERDDEAAIGRRFVQACAAEGVEVLARRAVPVDLDALGERARRSLPGVAQYAMRPPAGATAPGAERAAFRARRRLERALRVDGVDAYVVSCSFATVTYKALTAADRLASFYPDLASPEVIGWFALFHQRYSTNTTPSWERAQPFRTLGHNGEINTIAGNVRRMREREGRLGAAGPEDEALFAPVVDERGSDSAMLDEALELLIRGSRGDDGARLVEALATLVPAAWEASGDPSSDLAALYRRLEVRMEPWDGPAGLVFTDGARVGAALDRNGLRPLRLVACEDGLVGCASEIGVFETEGGGRVRRSRLGPGGMVLVDPSAGGLRTDPAGEVAALEARRRRVVVRTEAGLGTPGPADLPEPERLRVAHGYTREDLTLVLRPAAVGGKEPTFSMGDDAPIPPLASHPRTVFDHLRQRFAQVTNPALDPVRERLVMSTRVLLGPREPLLAPAETDGLLELPSFVLFEAPEAHRLDATWPVAAGPAGLASALDRLAAEAGSAVRDGARVLALVHDAVAAAAAPVPSPLAVAVVDATLLAAGLRTRASLVCVADDVVSSHHLACLVALGAEAVVPQLALASATEDAPDDRSARETAIRLRSAIEDGVCKILSKLGIATIDSYRGARLVDALGLAPEVTRRLDLGAAVGGGVDLEAIASVVLDRHGSAFGPAPGLANPGAVKFRRGGEHHANHPGVVRAMHESVDPGLSRLRSTAAAAGVKAETAKAANGSPGANGAGSQNGADGSNGSGSANGTRAMRAAHELRRATRDGDAEAYRRFASLVDDGPPVAVRDLLELVPSGPPVALEEVEDAAAITARFSTGAISHGAISREAHETLALGMRLIGGRANTGEGGEDPGRFRTPRNSDIKQVASGRFGVTPEYLAFAQELQIKIAQGSKPGEGGQLPGHKVTDEIARLRYTRPGVALISPAPHHDIYSIEDLAQLVHDLRQVNPEADVSVKLVAQHGVGTVAAGVVKALADVVHIAGADGGTGASPLASIRHAGLPWELGLVEAQHVLSVEGLRGRVRLRVDGGLKTGRDVVLAALLGADEFSFGTAVLMAEGCLMVRSCHLDTCPVGIATQRPELRARFAGTPEMVAAYLRHVAEDVRRRLAALGLRSIEDAIGRSELARPRGRDDVLELSGLTPPAEGERRHLGARPARGDARSIGGGVGRSERPRSELGDALAERVWPTLRDGGSIAVDLAVSNRDRSIGARLGGLVGRSFGESEPPGQASVTLRGDAGQSLGAFLPRGVEIRLEGAANDGVAKGMNGGRIVVVPPADDAGAPILLGNAALYGATGGELLVAGGAGERFGVRNSGATAVIEGAGDHCCEYMTGGTVVVLGEVGSNLAAGMTGGEAFVLDPELRAPARTNTQLVGLRRPDAAAQARLRELVRCHEMLTGSPRARALLEEWGHARRRFWHVVPREDVADVAMRQEGTARRGAAAAAAV